MSSPFQPSRWGNSLGAVVFVLSAALAALALIYSWHYPLAGAFGLVGLLTAVGVRWVSRRRAARLLKSGDIKSVLQRWSPAMQRVPHPETMGPLLTATALAAYGWIERAREILGEAERGPAWDAAVEHRLFLDALLNTFEGQSATALAKADALQRLPLPSAMPFLVRRIRVLRAAVGALARAFAHTGLSGDRQLLLTASDASPLVFWAMRYGAAIMAVDACDYTQALLLLAKAPPWPQESCFRSFHQQIVDEVSRLQQGVEPPAEVPPASGSAGQAPVVEPVSEPPAADPIAPSNRPPSPGSDSPAEPQISDASEPTGVIVDEEDRL